MMTKAVIDRFEGELAVLLLDDGDERLVVPRVSLPLGAREGQWLQVDVQDGVVVSAIIDEEETDSVKQRIAEKLERLRRGEHLE
jgi:hypothetical protein